MLSCRLEEELKVGVNVDFKEAVAVETQVNKVGFGGGPESVTKDQSVVTRGERV